MKPVLIECPTCHGCGKAPLEGALAETLEALRAMRVGSAIDVHAKLEGRLGVTAVNNRLEDLRALGLLIRTRDGRRWVYRYTKLKS